MRGWWWVIGAVVALVVLVVVLRGMVGADHRAARPIPAVAARRALPEMASDDGSPEADEEVEPEEPMTDENVMLLAGVLMDKTQDRELVSCC